MLRLGMAKAARLAVAAAFAALTVVPATQAEAIYCGPVVHTVCSTVCDVTWDVFGWPCVS